MFKHALQKFRQGCRPAIMMVAVIFLAAVAACATVGRDFPEGSVAEIKIKESSREDIREIFGSPWRIGVEDGQRTWTYGKYRYGILVDNMAKDLIIRFNDQGIVTSYSYNTTEHQQ